MLLVNRLLPLLLIGMSVTPTDAIPGALVPGDFVQRVHLHMKDSYKMALDGQNRGLQSVCLVVDVFSLEKEYELDFGVPFTCSCESEATSSNGVVSCSSDAPYCCPDKATDEIIECGSTAVSLTFAEKLSAFFIPYGDTLEGTSCFSYTAGPRSGSERCHTWEWWSCDNEESGDICSCDVTFDDTTCATCDPCGDTTTATVFDCSNVDASRGLTSPDCTTTDLSGCIAQTEANLPTAASTAAPQPTMGGQEPSSSPPPQETPTSAPLDDGEGTSFASAVTTVGPIAIAVLGIVGYWG